jgi:hypothetical protein
LVRILLKRSKGLTASGAGLGTGGINGEPWMVACDAESDIAVRWLALQLSTRSRSGWEIVD